MNIGSLRNRITLQYPDGTIIKNGAEATNYTDGLTVWAAIKPLRVKELFLIQNDYSECTTQITIRYVPNIAQTWKIKYFDGQKNIFFEIVGIIDVDMKHQELQLVCKVVS
jgi:phage head-tail adaptor, putative, SPP1 family